MPYLMVDRARAAHTRAWARAFAAAGASALELGYPFSDPIADGPVLQDAARRALDHGTRWSDLLRAARVASSELPVAVMTYANPVHHRGVPRALSELARSGVSGLIVPDLVLEESPAWRRAAEDAPIALILMAAPGGSDERIARLAQRSAGFLYLVARRGTTGGSSAGPDSDLLRLARLARRARPDLPLLVGFGVRDIRSARHALASGADGVIVGTAVEERLRHPRGEPGAAQLIRRLARLPSATDRAVADELARVPGRSRTGV